MLRRRLFPLALVLALVVTACSGDDDDGGDSASGSASGSVAEDEETTTTLAPEEALEGAGASATELPGEVEAWRSGELTDDEIRVAARRALVAAGEARESTATLDEDDESRPFATGAAQLYFQHATLVLEAVNEPDEARRGELLGLAEQLGEIGARTAEWAQYINDPDSVDPEPLPGDTEPPLDRPTQPEADWRAALEELAVPPAIDPNRAPAEQAGVFRRGADALGEEPDPDTEDGHLESARRRLDWLIKAAASDAARLGVTTVASELLEVVLVAPAEPAATDEEAAASPAPAPAGAPGR